MKLENYGDRKQDPVEIRVYVLIKWYHFVYLGLENCYNIPEVIVMPLLKEYFIADATTIISDLSRDMKRTTDVTRVFEVASLCFCRLKDSF